MSTATLERWVESVFDHSVSRPEWYWGHDFDEQWEARGLSDSVTVEYMTRLFLRPDCLKAYSLEQAAQAIWFLIGESSPAQSAYAFLKPDIPLHKRTDCVDAMTNFFRVFVAPAAHGAADERKNPFHIACYMWWDIFPTYGGPNAGEPALHGACLDAMKAILTIPSELCQLSALHGLNHWHLRYAERVESIGDDFLRKESEVTTRMFEYAAMARAGSAL